MNWVCEKQFAYIGNEVVLLARSGNSGSKSWTYLAADAATAAERCWFRRRDDQLRPHARTDATRMRVTWSVTHSLFWQHSP